MQIQATNPSIQVWAREVLREEQLELAEAKNAKRFERRKMSKRLLLLLWLLRVYLVLMALIIVVQLYIGVHQ
ncbi:MAG: hypothetical protein ACYDBJ_05050 [Aggregatilineales bacterium]